MSARGAWPWSVLGIARTADTGAIRKAYAAAIKAMDLDRDVEGYADLRGARDAALRQAKAMAASEVAEEPAPGMVDDEALEDAAPFWLHGAPMLDGAEGADPALRVTPPPASGDYVSFPLGDLALDNRADDVDDETPPLAAPRPLGPPVLHFPENAEAIGPAALASPFDRLLALLGEDAGHGNAPFDDAEEAEAHAALRGVIDAAHHADLSRQAQIELWLAGLLAEAWPRGAPLLEEATEAFGWSAEWGRFDARPVIEYLGARLRGYRFQQKVRAPDHRFHKAWAELVRPGDAGPLRFLRTTSSDVQGLLAGVRKHFPELEDHFDAQRVASWESGSAWPTGAIVVVGLLVLAFLFALGDPKTATGGGGGASSTDTPEIVVSSEPDDAALRATADKAVAEAFGAEWTPDLLRFNQPDLATTLLSNARYALSRKLGEQDAVEKAVEIVRQRSYFAGRAQTGDLFDRTMAARLGLLRAARSHSASACLLYLNSGTLPAGVTVPERVRALERSLARDLAVKGLLVAPAPSSGSSARVPGEMVEAVIRDTGLNEAQVAQGMQGKGSDANRCAVAIALLSATLDWRGDGRRAILLTL